MNGPNNPYSTTSLTNSPQLTMDVSTQIAKNREDEQQTKAPQTLPFTLDAANQVLGDMYMTLLQFKTMIQQTETEPKINKHPKKRAGIYDGHPKKKALKKVK